MNGFAPPYGQPPSAWQEHHTPDGRAYYYNSATKVTQWTKPEEMMTPAEVSLSGATFILLDLANSPFVARSRQPALEGIHRRRWPKVLV